MSKDMKYKRKAGKITLALLLSVIMLAESTAGAAVTYAAENAGGQVISVDENIDNEVENTADDATEAGAGTEQDASDETGAEQDASGEAGSGQDASGETETEQDASGEAGSEQDVSGETGSEQDNPETGDQKEDNGGNVSNEDGSDENEEKEPDEDVSDETKEDDVDAETEELEEAEDKTLDEEADKQDDEEGLDGFSAMPSGYSISSAQKEEKRNLADSMSLFDDSGEGTLYAAREVFAFADTLEEAEAIAAAYHAELIEYDEGVAVLKLAEDISVGRALRVAASLDNNLPAVYPNYYRYASVDAQPSVEESSGLEVTSEEYDAANIDAADEVSNETAMAVPSGATYNDPDLTEQWQHNSVGSLYAWDKGYQGQNVKVAILDSGVTAHEDLTIAEAVNKVTSEGAVTDDVEGHGTHVAGIIGATLNNNMGGAGIAPKAELYNVRVLGNSGSGSDAQIIQGIYWAMDKDVDIINMSLGGVGYDPAFQQVVNEAYEQGIAIFAAAGNDGGANKDYPAGYDHVICVAATASNNSRASFSNYGAWVDLSAPGQDIYSTYSKGGLKYKYLDGTSMACPVAAGEAAVILSAKLSALEGKTGGAKVDALEKIMKDSAVSMGSGMGKGVTNLPKALGINVLSVKPSTPVIAVEKNIDNEDTLSVKVTITADARTTIYYSTNGKAPAYKNGAWSNATVYTGPVTINNVKSGTIQAVAINEAGLVSKVKKATFKLQPRVKSIQISGVSQIVPGKSTQLKAVVTPDYAANKQVTWTIAKKGGTAEEAKSAGVSINKNGKVSATRQAQAGEYTVTATAKDKSGVSQTYSVTVITAVKVKTITLSAKAKTLERPKDPSYDVFATAAVVVNEGAAAAVAEDFIWTSSNAKVAAVSDKGVVTPLTPGKTTITALANDSSGKKATCTITVKQLATGVTISGSQAVAKGKKITLKAAVAPANVSNKNVTWKITDEAGNGMTAKDNGISINAKGVVATTAKAVPGTYKVTATSKDTAQKSSAAYTITVRDAASAITGITLDSKKATIFRVTNGFGAPTTVTLTATLKGGSGSEDYTVTSSNENIAVVKNVPKNATGDKVTFTVQAAGKTTGKATITIASTDGSNKKATCAVTVVNPVSKINVAPATGSSHYIVPGKSLTFKAALETEYGAISNKNVTWKIVTLKYNNTTESWEDTDENSNDYGVSINASNGKVTAKGNAKTYARGYRIEAEAKDGSHAKTAYAYAVQVVEKTTKLALYDILTDNDGDIIGVKEKSTKYTWLQPLAWGGNVYMFDYWGTGSGGFTVSSSNPNVVSATLSSSGGYYFLNLATYKKGSATITIKAMDGSGKQVKYKFKIT
ncbi:MAG: S8 family serine peptidase [Muribaculaceae bacterium]|nr:S8 family serine peptidase [Muribaculaceae bacterium]